MLFRTLQAWYDLYTYGDGRRIEEEANRDREWAEWKAKRDARRLGLEVPRGKAKEEFKIEAPSRQFYETRDGYRAAKLVEQQRYEEGRSKRYRRNLTEAHEQAEDAEQEGWAKDLEIAFEDFDKSNKQSRIDRLRKELDELLGESGDSDESKNEGIEKSIEKPKYEMPDWESINLKPGKGWAISNNGEPYQQMVKLREPILATVENEDPDSVEDEEASSDEEINWKQVNEQAKEIKNEKQALRLAEEVDQFELSDFWLQLAEEYERDEDKNKEDGE